MRYRELQRTKWRSLELKSAAEFFCTFQFPQGFHSGRSFANPRKPLRKDTVSRQKGRIPVLKMGVTLAQTGGSPSNRAGPSQNPRREKKEGSQEQQNALHGDAHDAKRQQNQPDERIKYQRKQRERPTEEKQDAPE
jgi:hypothetical protein